MKSVWRLYAVVHDGALPVRGAWIEIWQILTGKGLFKSLPVRGAWIEIPSFGFMADINRSLPVRGAWIEISKAAIFRPYPIVAPRKGSVD